MTNHSSPISAPSPTKEATLKMDFIKGQVSVIIPNYNHAKYIQGAIDSVLQQTYDNYEILVIDDGSTDNSRDVVTQYENERLHYIWQENQGLSAARNSGLRLAKGEYIALLDADDIYEPEFMKILVDVLEQNQNIDGVICGYQFVDDQNRPLPQQEARSIPPEQLYKILLDGNFLVPESILVRRHCYEAVGLFDETLSACEDWDMWLRISRKYILITVPSLLTRHRILAGSMSTDPKRMVMNRLAVLKKHLGLETAPNRRAYARAYLSAVTEYLQYQDIDAAIYYLGQATQSLPTILTELDTFYELALGVQPKGQRGHFATIDFERNEQLMLTILQKLFRQHSLNNKILAYRSKAYGLAYYALALLNYGAYHNWQTRRYLIQSIKYDFSQLLNRQLALTMIKTFVPVAIRKR